MSGHHQTKHGRSVEHTLQSPTTDLGERRCFIHRRTAKYYCMMDSAYICELCRLDGEHREHPVKALDEAKEKNTWKLGNDRKTPTSERGEFEHKIQRQEERRRQAATATERVTALFRDIDRQLENQEKKVISDIYSWEENISQQLEAKYNQGTNIHHTEELCSMTDPPTALQDQDKGDICYTETAGDLNEDVISDILLRLSDIIKCLQISTRHPADILLNEKTGDNCLLVSGDMKTASLTGIYYCHPATPERFLNGQVLSINCFSSGQHSWEVDTSNSEDWRVGMCYPSMARNSYIGSNDKSWSLRKYKNIYYCVYKSDLIQPLHQPSSHKFRIYLDYEAAHLSFYELCDTDRRLFTFSTTFTEPLHAAIYVGHGSVTVIG